MAEPATVSTSPLHQVARDNAGNELSPLATHQQKPDTHTAPEPGSLSRPSTARRGVISDQQYQRLDSAAQSKYALIRKTDADGSEWVPRDQLTAEPAEQATGDKPQPGDQPRTGDDQKKIVIGEMELTEKEIRDLMTAKADAELRKSRLPASPDVYEAKLPENFELPPGIEFKLDTSDPLLADARRFAHEQGFDQPTFEKMVGLYAAAKVKDAVLIDTAARAEVAKLGANGPVRVTALEQWLRGVVGDQLAKPMRSMMVTADIVRGLELIQQRMVSQGAASFSQAHREPHDAGKVTDERWASMSDADRWQYARGFDQRQFSGGG